MNVMNRCFGLFTTKQFATARCLCVSPLMYISSSAGDKWNFWILKFIFMSLHCHQHVFYEGFINDKPFVNCDFRIGNFLFSFWIERFQILNWKLIVVLDVWSLERTFSHVFAMFNFDTSSQFHCVIGNWFLQSIKFNVRS